MARGSLRSIWKLFFFTMLGLAVTYGTVEVVAALWSPTLTLEELSARIGEALRAEIEIEHGTLDPLAGTAEIEGLRIHMRSKGERSATLEVDRVHLDIEVGSVFGPAIVIDELELVHPTLTYVREGKGKRPKPGEEEPRPPPALLIRKMVVHSGSLVYEDRVVAPIPIRFEIRAAEVTGHDLSPNYPLSLFTRMNVDAAGMKVSSEHRGPPHTGPEGSGGGADQATFGSLDLTLLEPLTRPLPVQVGARVAELELDLEPTGDDKAILSGRIIVRGLRVSVRERGPLQPMLETRFAPLVEHLRTTGGELDVPFTIEMDRKDLRGYLGDVLREIALQVGLQTLRLLRASDG